MIKTFFQVLAMVCAMAVGLLLLGTVFWAITLLPGIWAVVAMAAYGIIVISLLITFIATVS